MKQRVRASVPGKLILMGEHAAVYGRPALVSAVGPRAFVSVTRSSGDLVIDLPDLGERSQISWSEVEKRTDQVRDLWSRYVESPTPERFEALDNDSPEHLVAIALGEIATEIGTADLPSIEVRVSSELPIGSGFGSSAATAVAVIGATLELFDEAPELDRIDRIALEVERRQHGLPSGVDHKTVLYGGVVWARRINEGEFEIEPLEIHSELLSELLVYQTGRPRESTGEVVAAVRRFQADEPTDFESRLDSMQECVESLRGYLCAPSETPDVLVYLMRRYERCLEEMGVVPRQIQKSIRAIEDLGGGAKISGAGALSGDAAGCLLVQGPGRERDRLLDLLRGYRRQHVELGAKGLRIEEVE